MARGHARAPSQNAYRGTVGKTQTQTVHVTAPSGDLVTATIHTTVDALSDPELVERLHSDDPERALNVLRVEGAAVPIAAPIVYHDPAAEVMVLVLGEPHRHRELDERIALLHRLRDDHAALPAYAKDFAVVFGASGLRAYLESRAHAALSQVGVQRSLDAAKDAASKLAAREDELTKTQAELARQRQDLAAQRSLLEHERGEQQRAHAELERLRAEQRARVIASVQAPTGESTVVEKPLNGPVPRSIAATVAADASAALDEQFTTSPVSKLDLADVVPTPAGAAASVKPKPDLKSVPQEPSLFGDPDEPATLAIDPPTNPPVALAPAPIEPEPLADTPDTHGLRDDSQPAVTATIIPPGSDPLTTDTIDLGPPEHDAWLDFAATGADSAFEVEHGRVRLALVVDNEQVARGLNGALDVRVLLHRMPTYPVVALVIGPPAAFRVPSPSQLAVVTLDIGAEHDRHVLTALGKSFELTVVAIHRGAPTRAVQLAAPLADNVQYIVRAADDHLRELGDVEPSFQRARDTAQLAGYDILGAQHPEAGEFRDDKLAQLQTAQPLRRAIAIARRFARPSREDYLVCTRGFPLQRWRDLRRHVLESAVAWGIWMGPELAQVAVSEGLARSRRDLIGKLDAAFEQLRANPTANDIDADAAADNAKALADEARALGVELHKHGPSGPNGANGHGKAIVSDDGPIASGSITGEPVPQITSPDQLIAMLDDKRHRVAAAAELCDRGEAHAAAAILASVKKMSRAEAVRILGKVVKLGPPAAPALIEGLKSSKAFLRHGSALALSLLRTDDGTHAIIELLLAEPTEVWREIARALGQVGPAALMPLASSVGRLGDRMTPQIQERVAWAMAHVGVRGGRGALEQMAAGQSVMAPVAQQAVGLIDAAAHDDARVRPGGDPDASRDVTVNSAFSRRFYEALEAPEGVGGAQVHEIDLSNPAELLDEADLIVDEEPAGELDEELDESDLIQT